MSPYYDTLAEDLQRAKEILKEGKADDQPEWMTDHQWEQLKGGTIYGKDTYAAYKLLESFVEEIDRLQGIEKLLKLQVERLREDWKRLLNTWVPADELCENFGHCACDISTRHEWFEAFCQERDALKELQHRMDGLEK